MADRIAGRLKLRVKQRRRVVEYALEQGIKPAARHFGLARRTVRTWVPLEHRGRGGFGAAVAGHTEAAIPETTRELIRIARVDHRYTGGRRNRLRPLLPKPAANVFNHTTWGAPVTGFTANNFLRFTPGSAFVDPRTIQVGLRVQF